MSWKKRISNIEASFLLKKGYCVLRGSFGLQDGETFIATYVSGSTWDPDDDFDDYGEDIRSDLNVEVVAIQPSEYPTSSDYVILRLVTDEEEKKQEAKEKYIARSEADFLLETGYCVIRDSDGLKIHDTLIVHYCSGSTYDPDDDIDVHGDNIYSDLNVEVVAIQPSSFPKTWDYVILHFLSRVT